MQRSQHYSATSGRAETSFFDGHGWKIPDRKVGDRSIHIGNLPGRKQVCLYVEDGSVIRVLAFFKTREQASEALNWLDALVTSGGAA